MQAETRRSVMLAASLVLTAVASVGLRPGVSPEAEARAQVPLESLFPKQIATEVPGAGGKELGSWRLDPVASGMVRPAFEAARRFQMYDQVLERTYVHPSGQRVMLSVAYGRQQSVGLQMHRPEVCYRAGGFRVSDVTPGELALPVTSDDGVSLATLRLPVVRLVASLPARPEPVTYWRLLGDEPVQDERSLRVRQLVAGLGRHRLADGLLVRVSTIDADTEAGWRWQELFARDMARALSPAQRARVLGAGEGAVR